MFKKIILFFLLSFLGFGFVLAGREIPKYHNFVNDYADIFTYSEENILNKKLTDLEKESDVEFAILTIKSLEGDSLENFSIAVARDWGIGKKNLNEGLLLLIVKNDRKIRLEIGYGLEGDITDAQAYWLIENDLKPNFRKNNFFGGVDTVVDKVVKSLLGDYKMDEKSKEKDIKKDIMLFLLVFVFIIFYPVFYWFYYRKYKIPNKYPKIIKEPYNNFHPFLTGFLIDKKINISDLMAGIIHLANRGYVEIQKKQKNGLIFDKENFFFKLKVKEEGVEDELDKLLIKFIFQSNFAQEIKRHGFYLVKSLESVINNPNKVVSKTRTLEMWLIKYSKKHNILEKKDILKDFELYDSWIKTVIFIGLILLFLWVFGPITSYIIIIILLPIVFLSYRYKKKGWEIKYQLESFKNYLEEVELEESEKTKETFLKYLPYAFAFSVEKKWMKKFDNLVIPDWYKTFEKDVEIKKIIKDLNRIEKIISGVGIGGSAVFVGNKSFSNGGFSGSVGFGGFGGGSFGGGGASGGW